MPIVNPGDGSRKRSPLLDSRWRTALGGIVTSRIRRIFFSAGTALFLCAIAAVPAHAEESGPYVALAYSEDDGVGAVGTGATESDAVAAAEGACTGWRCVAVASDYASDSDACLAVIKGATPADYWVGLGDTQLEAEEDAFVQMPGSGPLLVASGCATAENASTTGFGTATVISDVDIYAIPDGVGTPYPGVFLDDGDVYELVEPCRDNWCHLYIDSIPGGQGWVYQDGFLEVS